MIDLATFRRDLHAHPETGFDLERTSSLIATELECAGLEVVRHVGRTGVVATLWRGPDETAIGFRADMDALPIQETTNLPYRSKTEGKFHGCGHDGHSTMLLGAALKLAADPTLARTIHFIFQPDEENGNGASAMIADGLFERFPMGAIFGLHNMPGKWSLDTLPRRRGRSARSRTISRSAFKAKAGTLPCRRKALIRL